MQINPGCYWTFFQVVNSALLALSQAMQPRCNANGHPPSYSKKEIPSSSSENKTSCPLQDASTLSKKVRATSTAVQAIHHAPSSHTAPFSHNSSQGEDQSMAYTRQKSARRQWAHIRGPSWMSPLFERDGGQMSSPLRLFHLPSADEGLQVFVPERDADRRTGRWRLDSNSVIRRGAIMDCQQRRPSICVPYFTLSNTCNLV